MELLCSSTMVDAELFTPTTSQSVIEAVTDDTFTAL